MMRLPRGPNAQRQTVFWRQRHLSMTGRRMSHPRHAVIRARKWLVKWLRSGTPCITRGHVYS